MIFRISWIRMLTIKRRRKKTTSSAALTALYFAFWIPMVSAQCFGGVETYEKTVGLAFTTSTQVQGLVTQPGSAVTRDCATLCRQTANCAAFVVDYAASRCQSIDQETLQKRHHLKESAGSNYYEKICLRRVNNLSTVCGDRLWVFERVIGATLQGFDDSEETGVTSRNECYRMCLEKTSFTCRSAEYDRTNQICRLSREDRRSQPTAFRQDGGTFDYLENQCVRSLPDCRYMNRPESQLVSMDQLEFAQSQGECESLCDQSRVFTCRAYSFMAEENRCILSGDDSVSQTSNGASIADSAGVDPTTQSMVVYAEKICSISQCENGIFTFEKVSSHFLRSALSELLNQGKNGAGQSTEINDGITVECGKICLDIGSDCPAYSVDYSQGRCFKLDRNSQGRAQELTVRDGMSYFEKICLRGNNVGMCRDQAWAFERQPGKELRGFDDHVIPLMASRRDCQEACLHETKFVCRSAEYDTKTLDCRLSAMDRRLRPDIFIDASMNVEYLENQCLTSTTGDDCNVFQTVENMYPRYMDLSLPNVMEEKQCQQLCQQNRAFTCRSYSFYTAGNQCFISSENRGSVGASALLSRPGTNYTERKCVEPSMEGSSLLRPVPNSVAMMAPPSSPVDAQNQTATFTNSNFGPPTAVAETGNSIYGRNAPDKCRPGRTHFEKVTGYEAVGSRTTILRQMPIAVMSSSIANQGGGVLIDCLNFCRTDPRCLGFNYHTINQACYVLEPNDAAATARIDTNIDHIITLKAKPGVIHFTSNCFRATPCAKLWSIERWPGYQLRGYQNDVLYGVSRSTCVERCLVQLGRSACRSASYDTQRQECYLSNEDRHSQSHAFQANAAYEYIENQCAPESRQCRYGSVQSDRMLLYADRMISVAEPGACQAACDSERHFRCRSYATLMSHHSSASSSPSESPPLQCWLSSSTYSASAGSSGPASSFHQLHRGSKYVEMNCSMPVAPANFESHAGRPESQPISTTARNEGGGWVSLSSGGSRIRDTNSQASGAPSSGDADYPVFSSNLNPLMPRPIQTNRRPLDGPPFDLNSVAFPARTQAPVGLGETVGVNRGPPGPSGVRGPARPGRPNIPGGLSAPNGPGRPAGPIGPSSGTASGYPVAKARCRGSVTYDKVAYADYFGARRQEIKLSPPAQRNPVAECLRECDRMGDRCQSVVMETDRHIHYDFLTNVSPLLRQVCYVLDRSAVADGVPLQHSLYTMYFEKTCIPEKVCEKPWTFIRVQGFELEGLDDQVLQNVATKEDCQAACLAMSNQQCRSAEYVARERVCRLSKENRRTQLKSFKVAVDSVYMENQCAPEPAHCDYSDREGRSSPWFDRAILLTTFTTPSDALAECRRLCNTEREFLCKSLSLQVKRSKCFISSDDSISFNGPNPSNALMPDRDFIYSERTSCSNIRVECAKKDMIVTLSFGSPFDGRVYATGNPQACFEMGNGRNQVTLRIPLGSQCGTVQQSRGRYMNHIVTQQNPVIMTETDSTIRVECTFETPDQTVSYTAGGRREGSDQLGPGGLDVTAPFRPMGHNIVTNTAPSPSVRMRITSRTGSEITIVGLGETLTLRIEVEPESPFAISARNVEARTDNGEIMTLIDAIGCPRDRAIFPPLDVDPATRSLIADFKAFRFPSTATVNFVATVVFCQTRCEPTRCPEGWDSHGRRRRHTLNINNRTDTELHVTTEPALESGTPPMTPEIAMMLPVEVPVHLQLIVAPETGPVARPSRLTEPPPAPMGRGGEEWRSPSLVALKEETYSDSQLVCSAKATVIAVTVAVVTLHMILVAGFTVFYRCKRSHWMKWSNRDTAEATQSSPAIGGAIYPSGSVSDVTFRSVYRDTKVNGTLRGGLNLNFDSPSRCHVASVFQNPQ